MERNTLYVGRKCQHKVDVGRRGRHNVPAVSPPNKRHGNTNQTASHSKSTASSLAAPSSVALLERHLAETAVIDVNAKKRVFAFVEFLKMDSIFFDSCLRKTQLSHVYTQNTTGLLSER